MGCGGSAAGRGCAASAAAAGCCRGACGGRSSTVVPVRRGGRRAAAGPGSPRRPRPAGPRAPYGGCGPAAAGAPCRARGSPPGAARAARAPRARARRTAGCCTGPGVQRLRGCGGALRGLGRYGRRGRYRSGFGRGATVAIGVVVRGRGPCPVPHVPGTRPSVTVAAAGRAPLGAASTAPESSCGVTVRGARAVGPRTRSSAGAASGAPAAPGRRRLPHLLPRRPRLGGRSIQSSASASEHRTRRPPSRPPGRRRTARLRTGLGGPVPCAGCSRAAPPLRLRPGGLTVVHALPTVSPAAVRAATTTSSAPRPVRRCAAPPGFNQVRGRPRRGRSAPGGRLSPGRRGRPRPRSRSADAWAPAAWSPAGLPHGGVAGQRRISGRRGGTPSAGTGRGYQRRAGRQRPAGRGGAAATPGAGAPHRGRTGPSRWAPGPWSDRRTAAAARPRVWRRLVAPRSGVAVGRRA